MQAAHSFAPLAGRLAAKAAEIRPAEGAEVSWANFMALFWCAIFEMLICLCEALDARAAADARLAAARCDDVMRPVVATRAGRGAMPVAERAPRLALAPDVQAISPQRDAAALPETAEFAPTVPWLAWTRHPRPAWAVAGRVAIPPKNAAWRPGIKHTYFVTIS